MSWVYLTIAAIFDAITWRDVVLGLLLLSIIGRLGSIADAVKAVEAKLANEDDLD